MSAAVNHEIWNWVAWCWQGNDPWPRMPRRCLSAEGGYLPESVIGREEEARKPRRIVNSEHAQRVQHIYDDMPQLTRQILRYEYTQRAAYDQWEYGEEVGADGQLRKAWIRTGNTRCLVARLRLKISRATYWQHVQAFRQLVRREFASGMVAQ